MRSFVQVPAAWIHSPAEIMAACPITVTTSRCPRAFSRSTQKPFSSLWTARARPARRGSRLGQKSPEAEPRSCQQASHDELEAKRSQAG